MSDTSLPTSHLKKARPTAMEAATHLPCHARSTVASLYLGASHIVYYRSGFFDVRNLKSWLARRHWRIVIDNPSFFFGGFQVAGIHEHKAVVHIDDSVYVYDLRRPTKLERTLRYSDPSLKELDVSVSAGMVALYPDTQYTGSSRLVDVFMLDQDELYSQGDEKITFEIPKIRGRSKVHVAAFVAGCVICQYASPEPPDDIIGGEREDFTQVVNDVRTGVRTDLGCASGAQLVFANEHGIALLRRIPFYALDPPDREPEYMTWVFPPVSRDQLRIALGTAAE